MSLLIVSIAPIFIIGFYIYFRDKYEKEPIGILLRAFFAGALSVIPILPIEIGLGKIYEIYFSNNSDIIITASYDAFVVAAFTEELFKFLFFALLIWRNKNFNEKYDGIVYAVFVSLGFAAVENVLYVFENGMGTGILRAFTAVPAHAIFGITMGYFLGLAKMLDYNKKANIIKALVFPIILHGIYDFMLMSEQPFLLLLFIPFMIFMFIYGNRRMKEHTKNSVFKPENIINNQQNNNDEDTNNNNPNIN